MPGIEKYCKKCEFEIKQDGCTNYEGKKWCRCNEKAKMKGGKHARRKT